MGSSNSTSSKHGCEKEASAMIQTTHAAAKVSTMVQSKRSEFYATYQRQNFSLPYSIMFYLAKNPTSPELYQKMVQTCKDFFVKNPLIVTSELVYFGGKQWEISDGKSPLDLSKVTSKFWITDKLFVNSVDPNILASVMPKIFQCDAKRIFLKKQIFSFNDFSRLVSSAQWIRLECVTVKDETGKNVAVERIVEVAVNAKQIQIFSGTNVLNITTETMKILVKLSHFSQLDRLIMTHLPETFDLGTFYTYMKKNKSTKFELAFYSYPISEAYKNRLEQIVDEILTTETFDYMPPLIDFCGLDTEKHRKLQQMQYVAWLKKRFCHTMSDDNLWSDYKKRWGIIV